MECRVTNECNKILERAGKLIRTRIDIFMFIYTFKYIFKKKNACIVEQVAVFLIVPSHERLTYFHTIHVSVQIKNVIL